MDVKGAKALADRIAEARREVDSDLTKVADSGRTPSAPEVAKFTANTISTSRVPLDAWLGRFAHLHRQATASPPTQPSVSPARSRDSLQRVLERQARQLAGDLLGIHSARRSIARRKRAYGCASAITNVCSHDLDSALNHADSIRICSFVANATNRGGERGSNHAATHGSAHGRRVVALLGAASASEDSTAKCFGEQATIVSSGAIDGTAGDDVIVGSDGADTINAFGGDDLVCALGGNDLIRAGLGDDHLDGGEGNDRIAADVVGDLSPGSTSQPGTT